MVLNSNSFNQNFGFQSNPPMYGNNPMNPQQPPFHSTQKTPMNINFPNSAHQPFSFGGSSLNPHVHNFYADPYLLASSASRQGVNHSSYQKNNGFVAALSSNEAGLYKEYPGLMHPNTSQQLIRPPVQVQGHAPNHSHLGIQDFGSSSFPANPCMVNANRIAGDGNGNRTNERRFRLGIKGHWSQDEDRMLLNLVGKYGIKKWSSIARMMPGRLGKQLRERYNNHLRPGLKKDAWTEEEDTMLIQAHEKMGNKWAEIAKLLQGRSESDIKNRWNATKRKCMNAMQKSKNTPKPSSLFENYVKKMFNNSSPTSGESSAMGGSSSEGSNSRQAGTDGSVSFEDYGVPPVEADDNGGPMTQSQRDSLVYLEMLLQQ